MLTALGVTGERYKGLMTLAYGTGQDQWVAGTALEQHQQVAALISCEETATRILEVSPLLIPGLLQTRAYTRAIMVGEGLSPTEVTRRVELRTQRQRVITRPRPAHLTAIICQAALYQDVGGRDATLEQFRHLLVMARRDNVELRIVPFGRGWHPALEGHFQLIDGANLITSVFVDARRSTVWLHKPDDVRAYTEAADKVLRLAVSRDESLRFIGDLVHRLEKRDALPDLVAQVDP